MTTGQEAKHLNKRLKQSIERIQAVQTNAGPCVDDAILERLIGVEHGLLLALEKDNYFELWVAVAEDEIGKFHATIRKDCDCGVCRRKEKA